VRDVVCASACAARHAFVSCLFPCRHVISSMRTRDSVVTSSMSDGVVAYSDVVIYPPRAAAAFMHASITRDSAPSRHDTMLPPAAPLYANKDMLCLPLMLMLLLHLTHRYRASHVTPTREARDVTARCCASASPLLLRVRALRSDTRLPRCLFRCLILLRPALAYSRSAVCCCGLARPMLTFSRQKMMRGRTAARHAQHA